MGHMRKGKRPDIGRTLASQGHSASGHKNKFAFMAVPRQANASQAHSVSAPWTLGAVDY